MRNENVIVCFDLDETLRDARQRHHLSPLNDRHSTWDAYSAAAGADTPLPGAIALARLLIPRYPVYIISGSSESAREVTEKWLAQHEVPYDVLWLRRETPLLVSNGDMKLAVIRDLEAAGRTVALFTEDFPATAVTLRAAGVPVLQVAREGACALGKCRMCDSLAVIPVPGG